MKHIRIDRDGAVATLSITRRERFNSLDVETAQDLRKAGLQLSRDRDVRAVILRGDGGVFCSGADLKYIAAGGDDDVAYLSPDARPAPAGYGATFKQILEYIHSTISEIRRAPKPWIACVDGAAAAGGLGIAMACDLVIASERATFEWAYFKTGLTGAESTTFMLPRLVGFRKAMELVMIGPKLSATEARDVGLINEVAGDADARAVELATQLASAPTTALAIAKRLLNQAVQMDRLESHLSAELAELARVADGANFHEGLAAFFGRRSPRFGVE
ncbi:MAG: enoyl-CoA hydratase/isomerase family protein [Kofleriaceae bacterium]